MKTERTLVLDLRVRPAASRDRVEGSIDGRIHVRLRAPPVEGRANRRLMRFLASEFRVASSQVRLLRGERSRNKRVEIVNPRVLPDWLQQNLPPSDPDDNR